MLPLRLIFAGALGWLVLSTAASATDTPAPPAGPTGQGQPMQITGKTDKLELARVSVNQELVVNVPPERAFDAFTAEIAHWWSRDWLMGGGATTDLVLDLRPGGSLTEVYGPDGGMVWAEVNSFKRGQWIRFGIPEGVIWSGPGYFSVRFAATEDGAGTQVTLEHQSTQAYTEDGHSGYVQGWTELVGTRFKAYCAGEPLENAVN
jgi:uncharacterized protein YndB with AHSA1/START domain